MMLFGDAKESVAKLTAGVARAVATVSLLLTGATSGVCVAGALTAAASIAPIDSHGVNARAKRGASIARRACRDGERWGTYVFEFDFDKQIA